MAGGGRRKKQREGGEGTGVGVGKVWGGFWPFCRRVDSVGRAFLSKRKVSRWCVPLKRKGKSNELSSFFTEEETRSRDLRAFQLVTPLPFAFRLPPSPRTPMGCCAASDSEQRVTRRVDSHMQVEEEKDAKLLKILFLGPGGSGELAGVRSWTWT